MRTEAEFIDAVDCRFPYQQEAQAHRLIEEACAISPNAAFMIVHELARRPQGSTADDSTCLALLERLGDRFEHPLRDAVLGVARRMIRGDQLQVHDCVELMRAVSRHRGQFNALAVVYFSCEDSGMKTVDQLHGDIVGNWRRSN